VREIGSEQRVKDDAAARFDNRSDEAIEIFLLRNLTQSVRKLDVGKFLETFIVPLDEAIAMIRDRRITDAKSVAGLLWVDKWGR
jgi:ADP-ribose pyrophosphatase